MKERKVEVFLDDRFVGTLAETADRRVAFAYSDEWLETGFSISPFSLPVEQKVFVPTATHFQGLWGVFADNLPDAWGRLLVNRMLCARGLAAEDVTPLERLAIVGDSGMGALTYRPAWDVHREKSLYDWDELAEKCRAVLHHEDVCDLDALFQMGGSSGGARPKVMTAEWIIKFPASGDMRDTGFMEKEYMDCAADCGIIVPETRLMPSKQCSGYFAVRRFDREQHSSRIIRRHMLTAAAILELDWRMPSLDYNALMKLTTLPRIIVMRILQKRPCQNCKIFLLLLFPCNQLLHRLTKPAVHQRQRRHKSNDGCRVVAHLFKNRPHLRSPPSPKNHLQVQTRFRRYRRFGCSSTPDYPRFPAS